MAMTKLTVDERRVSVPDDWPPPAVFLDLSSANLITTGAVRCTGIAVCDEAMQRCLSFYQGQAAHFCYEFEIIQPIAVPSGGVEIHDALGRLIHGKNTFQYGTAAPEAVEPGMRLRFHHVIRLDLNPGEYRFSIGLATTSVEHERRYRNRTLADAVFRDTIQELCRVMNVGVLCVELDPAGRLLHHGMVNLPGDCQVSVVPTPAPSPIGRPGSNAGLSERGRRDGMSRESSNDETIAPAVIHSDSTHAPPTIFHVTHWKAGSQWINRILTDCVPERIVAPQVGGGQFLYWPLQQGKVYPTIYVSADQFAEVQLPTSWRRFVIIRDLRDTLISAYFSLKVSHPEELDNAPLRDRLQTLSFEAGLALLMDEWLPGCARIQLSWQETGERLIRYEDLLEHDQEILEPLLLEECQLPVEPMRLREIILANRFEQQTVGRARGQEDIRAHERKGIAGDWRNHFSDAIKRKFKNRFGAVLIATGYERDLVW
jgi:lipopolysaccharide transport system ATP-binding protein